MSGATGGVGERVFRKGVWLSVSSFLNNLFGFVYWFVVSAVAGRGVLGYASTAVGLSSMISGLSNLGVGVGVQKFVGDSFKRRDRVRAVSGFWSSFLFLSFFYSLVSGFVWVLYCLFPDVLGLPGELVAAAVVLTVIASSMVSSSFLNAVLKTEVITVSSFVGNVVKLGVGLGLLFLGWGWVGVALGYAACNLVIGVVNSVYVARRFGFGGLSLRYVLDVVRAGVVSWVPATLVMVGQWLGLVVVFGSSGAVEAGGYYVAMMVSGFVVSLSMSSTGLLLPVLSSMVDGRKRTCSGVLKLSLALAAPLVFSLVFYPGVPLGLLGEEYLAASDALSVLSLASLFNVCIGGVTALAYSYDSYLAVLGIGVATSIPRVAAYLLLVPLLGGYGAAISFLLGGVSGLLASAVYAWRVGFRVSVRDVLAIVFLPALLGGLAWLLSVHWVLGVSLVVGVSYFLYMRTGVLTYGDVATLYRAFVPSQLRSYASPIARLVVRVVYGGAAPDEV